MNNATVAQTIAQQLGSMTLRMLGAWSLTSNANGLAFKIRGSKKCNAIRIDLEPSDTYKVTFLKVTSTGIKSEVVEGVYVDSLHSTIQASTGLYTKL